MEQAKATPKQMTKSNIINFYSLLNRPKTIKSPVGKKIYEWDYFDEKGKLQKDKMNVYESIQSFARQVDYKEKIKRGEEIENGTGLYMDTSELCDGYIGLDKYIANLINNLQSSIQEKQVQNQNGKNHFENTEVTPESKETSKQTSDGTNKGDD